MIAYFQSAYNQYCIQDKNSNNKISVDGNIGPQTQEALEVAKVASPDSECHKAYSKYKNILDKLWGSHCNNIFIPCIASTDIILKENVTESYYQIE